MTTRRSFLTKLALGVAGFTILPAATTYARSWKKTEELWVPINPEFPIHFREFGGKWTFHLEDLGGGSGIIPKPALDWWNDHIEGKPFPKLNLK